MAEVGDFHPLIRPMAPAAPIPNVDLAIVKAARRLAERTRCWRETFTLTAEDGTTWYDISLEDDRKVWEVDTVYFNGCRLHPAPFASFSPEEMTHSSIPIWYLADGPRIGLVPRGAGTATVTLFLVPEIKPFLKSDTYLPDVMRDRFSTAIMHGALADLLATPAQAWTNEAHAVAHEGKFLMELDTHFAFHVTGAQRAPLRSRTQYF